MYMKMCTLLYKIPIVLLFSEFSLGPNGMVLIMDGQGRTTGDAYVQFSSPTEAGNAIQKRHMKKMGHR